MLKRDGAAADPQGVMGTGARGDARDDGISLVEVMVAMGVFVAASLSLLAVLSTTVAGTFDNRARVTAAQVAASDIDLARAQAATDYYALAGDAYQKSVGGRTYDVVRTVAATMSSGAPSSCVGTSARQMYKRVTSTVTSPGARMRPVRSDTLVRAPVYDPNSNTGAIGLVVIDRSGNPLSGLPASTGALNRTTDSKGCAFFDGLAPGTHTATVTRAGSVMIAGSPTLNRQVSVSKGQITSAVLRVDTAVNLTTNSSRCCTSPVTSFTLPTGLVSTISSPDRVSPTRVDYTPKTVVGGADLTWAAFPAPGGYDAYLGPCQGVKRFDAEPGTTPPKVLLPLSTVTVQLYGGNASQSTTQGKTVRAIWKPTTCSETLTFATTTANDCKANAMGADGCYLYIALPAGTWRIELTNAPSLGVDVTTPDPAASRSVQINVP